MREVRRDPLTGRWAILSSRRVPPELLSSPSPRGSATDCPFCPGHEHVTEATIQAVERDGRWLARAFANRRPALVIEEELRGRGFGPFDRVSGTGAHEVIVESPLHDVPLTEQPAAQMAAALGLARGRLADLQRDDRFQSFWWFRNHGAWAGASVDHPHAQILALPVVPPVLGRIVRRSRRWLKSRGRELLQDVVDHEREDGRRLVWEGERVVALCSWAPSVPFEVWLVPTQPSPRFAQTDDRLLEELAVAMRFVLRQLARALGDPAYNAVLYTAPRGAVQGFRWHVRILPRLTVPAAFELGTGEAMHWVFPEEAAAALRM